MSNLSQRVQKSKSLKFGAAITGQISSHKYVAYGFVSPHSEKTYEVKLQRERQNSPFGDQEITHDVITVNCKFFHPRNGNLQLMDNCPGNSKNTICYHGLGAIRHHLAQKGYTIAFCANVFDAVKLRKPNQTLVKVVSDQGEGILWAVVAEKPKPIEVEDWQAQVELMRGPEEAGID
jgi:hypothetical protein